MAIELPGLTGQGPDVTLLDPVGGAPATVIDTDHDFQVQVDWSLGLPGATLIGGRWLVRAYAESIGPGEEERLGAVVALSVGTFVDVGADRRYRATINVPAGSLAAESDVAPLSSGVYKLVAIVTHENPVGGATVIAGFSEGPVFQMRNP